MINRRNENKQKEKIGEYITLLTIAHTTEPTRLLNNLQNMIEIPDKSHDDEVGDIKALKLLKSGIRRGGKYGN